MAISVGLDDELKNRVQHVAALRQHSAHWIMCQAIAEYVDREEARENFKQEALLSWQHFQETGLHLTQDEVNDWLDTWGTNKAKEKSKCHE